MNTHKLKKITVLISLLMMFVAQGFDTSRVAGMAQPPAQAITISISPSVPSDIRNPQNLQNAAIFGWQEFIALNWPAVAQTGQLGNRDTANRNVRFGDPYYTGPLVWHTYRHKVEIFPGLGKPHGYAKGASQDYGYDELPQYIYSTKVSPTGVVPPFGPTDPQTPWINLDENSEIGLDTMFAGAAPADPVVKQQILFLAKANRAEYKYVAGNGWWVKQFAPNNKNIQTVPPITATAHYLQQNQQDPPPGSSQYVSFPNGTIEAKSAWRQLTATEASSGRFYKTTIRFYRTKNGKPAYVDQVWGMVALHIIQKTPSAPYFIFATFSQADNLLDVSGHRVEDENGKLILNQNAKPLDPNVMSQNATSANPANANSIQRLSPKVAPATLIGKRLYYINTPNTPTTQGGVALNKRKHDIPQTIINVNQAAHQAIMNYNQQNGIQSSPWLYYKLVNVQYQPLYKQPGIDYNGPDVATFYQANEVVETDYNLQVFSGQFQGSTFPFTTYPPPPTPPVPDPKLVGVNVKKLITDYNINGTPFSNTYFNGRGYNMGGCMGCHGNAQVAGADFSFILKAGPVSEPDTVGSSGNLKRFLSAAQK
jgi:hypothetical protein